MLVVDGVERPTCEEQGHLFCLDRDGEEIEVRPQDVDAILFNENGDSMTDKEFEQALNNLVNPSYFTR